MTPRDLTATLSLPTSREGPFLATRVPHLRSAIHLVSHDWRSWGQPVAANLPKFPWTGEELRDTEHEWSATHSTQTVYATMD